MNRLRTVVLIWLAWAIVLIGFQALAQARFDPKRPDRVLAWTISETNRLSQNDQPYLLDPFMNNQVSWDAEFYLSIAMVGYDDPDFRTLADFPWSRDGGDYSLNYAFLPFYPFAMRVVAAPLKLLGLTPLATLTLAGVLVSLLGTLVGMVALYDITRAEFDAAAGIRAAFYLVVFPSGFFFAQVYTEGLFVGLAFGSLALLRRKKWFWAAMLAALATWTRAVGGALLIPLAWSWLCELRGGPPRRQALLRGVLVVFPLAAFLVWRLSPLGTSFAVVEEHFFGRGPFLVLQSLENWNTAFRSIFGKNLQTRVYYLIEFGAATLGVVACLVTLRRYPGLSLFGLAVIAISFFSGQAQGMHRYVLGAPSLFIVLGRWGRNEVFDRAWTVASVLLMGLLATLFAFDMWVG